MVTRVKRTTKPRLTKWFGLRVAAARVPVEFRGRLASAGSPTNIKVCQNGKIILGIDGNYQATEEVEGGRRVLQGAGRDNGKEALLDEADYQALRQLWQ